MPTLSVFTWKGFYYMLHMMLPFSGLICLCLGASCDSPWCQEEPVGTSIASFLECTLTIKPDHQHLSGNSSFKDPGSQFLWQPPEGCDHQIAWLWQPVELGIHNSNRTTAELFWFVVLLFFKVEVQLQYCVSFRYTAKWFVCVCMSILFQMLFLLKLLQNWV